jgi:ABC-type Fe3+/spermidine/putrescine transport system ATPase subunit
MREANRIDAAPGLRRGGVGAALRQARTELAQLRLAGVEGAAPGAERDAAPGVALAGASKSFTAGRAEVTAVDNFTLDIPPGRLISLIGPSGCGKTTLLRLIAGLIEPDAGAVRVDGKPPSARDGRAAMVFQNPALWPHKTVFGNVAAALERHAKFPAAVREHVAAILPLLQLSGFEDRYPSELSAGERQRVALARALAGGRKLWLLDDPLAQLDGALRATLRGEIKSRQQRTGATCVHATADVSEAFALSDTLAVIDRGRLLQAGTPQEIYARPASRAVAALLGPINFLPGRIAEIRMGIGRIDAGPDLQLEMPVPAGMKVGDGIEVAIRPENVRLSRLLAPPKNGARGMIEAHAFLGNFNVYDVRLASGRLVHVQAHPAQRFAPRGEVSIEMDIGQCMLFRSTPGVAASEPSQPSAAPLEPPAAGASRSSQTKEFVGGR